MSARGCSGFFLLCIDLDLLYCYYPGFCECVENRSSLFWQITQDLNKINKKKNPKQPFLDIGKVGNVCKISTKIIKFYGNCSLSKFSIFQGHKNTWFLENNIINSLFYISKKLQGKTY